jgi:pyrroline-5-carboxylate reductase
LPKKLIKIRKLFTFLIYFLIDFQKLGVKTTHLNSEVVTKSNMVVIAVKPNTVQKVLTEVKDYVSKDKLMVSIAAGVTLSTLEKVRIWQFFDDITGISEYKYSVLVRLN